MADNHREQADPRLDRIENKIDKLSDAMVSLARTEEKILSLEADRVTQNTRLNSQSSRITEIEKLTTDNVKTVRAINRVFWTIITTFSVTVLGKFIFGIESLGLVF